LGSLKRELVQALVKAMDIEIDTFRIFIRDEEDKKRSSTWHVNNTGNSVYLYVNSLGGRMKASFHPEGKSSDGKDSQFGFEKKYREKLTAESYDSPKPLRWIRPKPVNDSVVQVAKVLFPTDYLKGSVADERENYKRETDSKRKWRFSLPIAKEGEAVEVSLFYSIKKPNDIEDVFIRKGFTPMFYIDLPNGEIVSVVGRNVAFDPKSLPNPNKNPSIKELDGMKQINDYEENLHITLFGDPKDGEVFQLIEIDGPAIIR